MNGSSKGIFPERVVEEVWVFTGLVASIGSITARERRGSEIALTVSSEAIASELEPGASVSVSGVCLTATSVKGDAFAVDVAAETARRTLLGDWAPLRRVNLELPLRPADRLGGHFVQGHVDEVGRVRHAGARESDYVLRVEHGSEYNALVVEKGSIAIDGVSLTVTRCDRGWFEVMLIPHTLAVTTLSLLAPGDGVHLEYDILAKHIVRMMQPYLESGRE